MKAELFIPLYLVLSWSFLDCFLSVLTFCIASCASCYIIAIVSVLMRFLSSILDSIVRICFFPLLYCYFPALLSVFLLSEIRSCYSLAWSVCEDWWWLLDPYLRSEGRNLTILAKFTDSLAEAGYFNGVVTGYILPAISLVLLIWVLLAVLNRDRCV